MTNTIIIIGAILFLGILWAVFRVHKLVEILDFRKGEGEGLSNKVNGLLMLLFIIGSLGLFFWYSYTHFDSYNLPQASIHGAKTDYLFWVTTAITGVVFVITNALLFGFSFRYQHRPERKARFYPDNSRLELIWTIVPAIALTVLIAQGYRVWSEITDTAPEDSEVVEVMGYQFAWKARYPGKDNVLGKYDFRLIDVDNQFGMDFRDPSSFDDFIPREIHIPKGKPVLFKIRARDVLHSFYAPHFRMKMDAVPGMPTRFWMVPTKTTAEMRAELNNPDFNYEVACAEICGRGHFSMRQIIVVDEPEDYEKWKNEHETWLSRNPEYLKTVPHDAEMASMMSDLAD